MKQNLISSSFRFIGRHLLHAWIMLGLLYCYCTNVHAFDNYPEFHTLSENEAASLDETSLIDSEYESDVITYLLPLAWSADFHRATNAFDFTLGSLSSNLFLEHSRLKLKKNLLPDLTFHFTYFQQRDLDVDQTHAMLELVQTLHPRFAISVYGEPSLYKRENDLGAALLYHPSSSHEVRLFHTWVDLTRQAHSDRSDSFVNGSEPRSMGIVGRCSGCLGISREQGVTEISSEQIQTRSTRESDWLEYFVRWESPTKWRFPSDGYEYFYEFISAGLSTRLPAPNQPDLFLNLRLQASRKIESYSVKDPSSTQPESALDRQLLESLASLELPRFRFFGRKSSIEPGLGYFHRYWRGSDDAVLDHRNLLPFAWLKLQGAEHRDGRTDLISLGYEITYFSSEGAPSLAAGELKAWAAEHRLNFRYEIPFEDHAALSFALTADGDAAIRGSGGLFEGGNGQFRILF